MQFPISLAPNVSNFYNLAFFVCRLLTDGRFRTGHILYDPNAFHVTQLITDIQSNCSHSVPWLSTDITADLSPLPWKPDEKTDRILQLIFIDLDKIPTNIDDFQRFFIFYSLFVVSSIEELDTDEKFTMTLKYIKNNNNLVLHFNPETKSINVHLVTNKYGINKETKEKVKKMDEQKNEIIDDVFNQNEIIEIIDKNLFDLIFKKYEQNWFIAISEFMPYFHGAKVVKNKKSYSGWNGYIYSIHFFNSKLKAAYIKRTELFTDPVSIQLSDVRHKLTSFYKELSTQYEPIDKEKLSVFMNILYFS